MQDEHEKTRRVFGRLVLFTVLLLISSALIAFLFVSSRQRQIEFPRPAAEDGLTVSPLIGSWSRPNHFGEGTTALLKFESDGEVTSRVFSDETGVVLHDESGTWSATDSVLMIRKHRKGISSLLDAMPGVEPIGIATFPIVSVSEDDLKLGEPDDPLTYRRKPAEQTP